MIELQKLIYFTTIVDHNFSLSKASQSLNITQPTLSLTIEQLEKHYKIKLLEKEKNKYVRLTSAGKVLYDDAKKMIELSNQTSLKLLNIDEYLGELKIAIPPVTQPIVCSKVIPLFKKKYPNIKLTIIEEGAFIAKNLLTKGDLDFGFLTIFETDPNLVGFQIYESDVVAIFKKDHPLANKKFITTSDLADYDIVGLDENFNLHRMINVYFNNHNTNFEYFHTTSRWDYAVEIIAQSKENFITILPAPILKIYQNNDMIYKRFVDSFKWKVNLCYRKTSVQSKECLLFIEFVKDFFNKK